jgi:hypothetical protein
MAFTNRAEFESLRTLAYTGISGTYAAIGGPTISPTKAFRIINNTDGDMIVSDDPNNTSGKWLLPKNTYVSWDLSTNRDGNSNENSFLMGTTFYVKQITVPTMGEIGIEAMYAQ